MVKKGQHRMVNKVVIKKAQLGVAKNGHFRMVFRVVKRASVGWLSCRVVKRGQFRMLSLWIK